MKEKREIMGVTVELDAQALADDYELLELTSKMMKTPSYFVDVLHYLLTDAEYEAAKDACRIDGRVSTERLSEFCMQLLGVSEQLKN